MTYRKHKSSHKHKTKKSYDHNKSWFKSNCRDGCEDETPENSEDFIQKAKDINNAIIDGEPIDGLLDSLLVDFGAKIKFGTDGSNWMKSSNGALTLTLGLEGNDLIIGGNGTDAILGGGGHDKLLGGCGDDALFGDDGNDKLFGQHGNDYINGGDGNDIIFGGDGDDYINRSNGDDWIFGGDGNDTLEGGAGDDYISGGAGDDFISAAGGDDILKGGEGADTFFWEVGFGEGADVIKDFEFGTDKVLFRLQSILDSTPGLADADGDPELNLGKDLDASDLWLIQASEDGDVLVTLPEFSIEFDGIAYDPSITFEMLVDTGALDVF